MICCEGYFERGNCPKYLKPVCEMMQKVNECAFLDDKDNLDLFVDKLELLLEKSRIKNSTAHIDVCYSDTDRGQISLYAKRTDQDVAARIHFFRIRGILEYDEGTAAFGYVSEEFLQQKGGIS